MELWTTEHLRVWLPILLGEIAIAAILGIVWRNRSKRFRMIPVAVITGVILLLEVAKQIYCIKVEAVECGGYDLYRLPVHFCSLFLYYLPFFVWFGMSNRPHSRFFTRLANSMTVTCGATLFTFMVLYPNMVYGAEALQGETGFLDFHTVTYHGLCTFAFLLILSLGLYDTEKNSIGYSVGGVAVYGIFTGTLSNLIQTNYGNFYECPIDGIEAVRLGLIDQIGVWGQVIYVSVFILLIIAFSLLSLLLFRLLVWGKEALQKKFS